MHHYLDLGKPSYCIPLPFDKHGQSRVIGMNLTFNNRA